VTVHDHDRNHPQLGGLPNRVLVTIARTEAQLADMKPERRARPTTPAGCSGEPRRRRCPTFRLPPPASPNSREEPTPERRRAARTSTVLQRSYASTSSRRGRAAASRTARKVVSTTSYALPPATRCSYPGRSQPESWPSCAAWTRRDPRLPRRPRLPRLRIRPGDRGHRARTARRRAGPELAGVLPREP